MPSAKKDEYHKYDHMPNSVVFSQLEDFFKIVLIFPTWIDFIRPVLSIHKKSKYLKNSFEVISKMFSKLDFEFIKPKMTQKKLWMNLKYNFFAWVKSCSTSANSHPRGCWKILTVRGPLKTSYSQVNSLVFWIQSNLNYSSLLKSRLQNYKFFTKNLFSEKPPTI